jgi:hypothetical protein
MQPWLSGTVVAEQFVELLGTLAIRRWCYARSSHLIPKRPAEIARCIAHARSASVRSIRARFVLEDPAGSAQLFQNRARTHTKAPWRGRWHWISRGAGEGRVNPHPSHYPR